MRSSRRRDRQPSARWTVRNDLTQGDERGTYGTLGRRTHRKAGLPTGREAQGSGVSVVVRARESRAHGEGRQATRRSGGEVCAMQSAETVLNVLRQRGQRRLPVQRLYRQLTNPDLYRRAYARLYPNAGALTPGSTPETVDGM